MMTPGRLAVGLVGTAPELAIIGLALAGAGHFPWTITEPAPADRERVVSLLRGVSIQSPADVVASTRGPSTTKCSSDRLFPGGIVSVLTYA